MTRMQMSLQFGYNIHMIYDICFLHAKLQTAVNFYVDRKDAKTSIEVNYGFYRHF